MASPVKKPSDEEEKEEGGREEGGGREGLQLGARRMDSSKRGGHHIIVYVYVLNIDVNVSTFVDGTPAFTASMT